MKTAPLPPNESERQALLMRLEAVESASEGVFDGIASSVALICDCPVAFVNLREKYHALLKTGAGCGGGRYAREAEFCAQAPFQEAAAIVADAREDERFAHHPYVSGEPGIRFYAGVPLKLDAETSAGTLCVVDYRPHDLELKQQALLELLGAHLVAVIRVLLEKSEASRAYSSLVLAKQKLQFQKELTEAFLDNEPESVIILSARGEVEQINRAGLALLGAGSPEEVRGRRLAEYVLPEYRGLFEDMQRRVLQGGHAVAEYKMRVGRNGERWLESHAAPLYDRKGDILSLIAITRDISHIKQSQQALALAARIFSDAQEGMIITDARSVILDVNAAFCNITGYSREEIIGQTPRILQSGLQGPEFYEELWRDLLDSGYWKGEIWSRRKNGELYAELLSINALRDEKGQPINYVAQFLDITDYKRQQGELPQAAKTRHPARR